MGRAREGEGKPEAAMILLDTHALYWAAAEPRRLSRRAARAIEKAASTEGVGIASVTLYELAELFRRGRIRATGTSDVGASIASIVSAVQARLFDITTEIATAASHFPIDFSHDPMDRLIAATARVHEYALVTRDERMQDSKLVRTIW
jgi:PIN domain nuclease of toxin-antitoxin system